MLSKTRNYIVLNKLCKWYRRRYWWFENVDLSWQIGSVLARVWPRLSIKEKCIMNALGHFVLVTFCSKTTICHLPVKTKTRLKSGERNWKRREDVYSFFYLEFSMIFLLKTRTLRWRFMEWKRVKSAPQLAGHSLIHPFICLLYSLASSITENGHVTNYEIAYFLVALLANEQLEQWIDQIREWPTNQAPILDNSIPWCKVCRHRRVLHGDR